MPVKENYGRDAPSRIPAVRVELSERRGSRFMAEIQLEKTALEMCIRDRLMYRLLAAAPHVLLTAEENAERERRNAVSYTHLDVYKRQPFLGVQSK